MPNMNNTDCSHSQILADEETIPRKLSFQGDIFVTENSEFCNNSDSPPSLESFGHLSSSENGDLRNYIESSQHSDRQNVERTNVCSSQICHKDDAKVNETRDVIVLQSDTGGDSLNQNNCRISKTNVGQSLSDNVIISISADYVNSEDEQLLPEIEEIINSHSIESPTCTKVYRRRFWILFVFSFFSFFACLEWNAWGPISESMIAAFPDWTYGTVAWMESLVTGMHVVSVLPICWATGRYGLRMGMVFATSVLAVGLSLRCITDKSPIFTIMCHICSVLLGMTMTLIQSAPPLVASAWFPQSERTSATALIMAASQLGSVGSYLEPLVVQEPEEGMPSSRIRDDVMFLMYVVAGVGVGFWLVVLIHFPSKPPLPPSVTSSTNRLEFKLGVMALIKDTNLMKLMLSYGMACGPSLGLVGMLNYSLEPLGYNQNESMFIGLVGVLSCVLLSIVTGWFTDYLYGYMRETIVVLLILAALAFYWFLLISNNVIELVNWQVYVSLSLGLGLNYATIPLFYELAAEMAYPVHEMLVGGFVTASECLFTSLFLFIFLFKDIGFTWVTYVLVGSNALPVLGLFFVEQGYRRSKLDRKAIDIGDDTSQ